MLGVLRFHHAIQPDEGWLSPTLTSPKRCCLLHHKVHNRKTQVRPRIVICGPSGITRWKNGGQESAESAVPASLPE